MSYLDRLKQLENEKNSHYVPDSEPSKPAKVPFEGFEGMGSAHIEKKFSDNDCVKNSHYVPDSEPSKPSKPETPQEARRQKVIAMLAAAPDTQRAIVVDTDADSANVILTVAVRACQQTCELLIPKAKYDPWRLLELVERLGQTSH